MALPVAVAPPPPPPSIWAWRISIIARSNGPPGAMRVTQNTITVITINVGISSRNRLMK